MHRPRPVAVLPENIGHGVPVLRTRPLPRRPVPRSRPPARRAYDKYHGYPDKLLRDARTDVQARAFVTDRRLWLTGTIDANDFSREEQEELLDDYGYAWEDFTSDADRNQIICENHFEQYPLDYRNDI